MSETFVSKTVSLKLGQVQWLTEKYGNVTKGIRQVIEEQRSKKSLDVSRIESFNNRREKRQ